MPETRAGLAGAIGELPASDVHRLVEQAQRGDDRARDALLRTYRPFVMKAAAAVSGRFVRAGWDDEASVAMLAFNEAISSYRHQRGSSFFSFAEMVIRRRLIDHFRQTAGRRQEIPMSGLAADSEEAEAEDPLLQVEVQQAQRRFEDEMLSRERREEILRLSRDLGRFGIRFADLVQLSPRHRDARQRAVEVARTIAANPELRRQLIRKGNLPLKEMEPICRVSRKTLERQRKYIIALALILCGDFPHLREYLDGVAAAPEARPQDGGGP